MDKDILQTKIKGCQNDLENLHDRITDLFSVLETMPSGIKVDDILSDLQRAVDLYNVEKDRFKDMIEAYNTFDNNLITIFALLQKAKRVFEERCKD